MSVRESSPIDRNAADKGQTQNSPARAVLSPLFQGPAEVLTSLGVSPNTVTRAGYLLTIGGSSLKTLRDLSGKGRQSVELGMQIIGLACDFLDGKVAAVWKKRRPGMHDEHAGQILDARTDRERDCDTAYLRAIEAFLKGDKFGETAAYLAAVTSTLPSLARALVEWRKGLPVPEGGRGTSIERVATSFIATNFTKIGGLRLQGWMDLYTSGANVYAFSRRLLYLGSSNEPTLSDEKREDARERFMVLAGFTGETVIRSAVLPIAMRKLIGSSDSRKS